MKKRRGKMSKLFKNKDVKVIILEVFLIALGLVGLTLGVKYIMNSINVNIDTSKLAIDSMNANVTNGTLTPIEDSTVNINTTSNVLRITFDVKGASTNTGNNIIYDAILNIDADCSLKNENVKWRLYKNNNLLTSGNTSPKYDKDVLNGKITLTDTQQDLVPYSGTADKYVFILWMSESCNEEDITKCDLSNALTSDSGGKSISGNIDIRLNSGKKKVNSRGSMDVNACSLSTYVMSLDDGTTGDSGSGVYKVHHDEIPANKSGTGNKIDATDDYRYYGASPNNYVCLDNSSGSTCEDRHLYRIIGSLYEELDQTYRVKVVKSTSLKDDNGNEKWSWDLKADGSGKNVWATPTNDTHSNSLTNGSTLMQLLNSGYWWNGTGGVYYSMVSNTVIALNVDFFNTGLSGKAKNLISLSRYYLGASFYGGYGGYTSDFYAVEKSTNYFGGMSIYWDGYIGLLYNSDVGYASGKNIYTSTKGMDYYKTEYYKNDWILSVEEWGLTSFEGSVWLIGSYTFGSIGLNPISINIARPVFYLSKDVVITGGTGTIDDPYTIGL